MLGIYCRISKKKEESKDDSIPTQKERGVILANQLNMPYEFYVDSGISGTKDEISDRPGFAKMFKDIGDGKISAVFTQYQDRLERNSLIWQLFVTKMLEKQCKFYPGGKFLDLENPQNRFMATVMSASNALYAALTSMRVKDSIQKKASESKFRGIKAYGYCTGKDGKLAINEAEAKVIRRIYDYSESGIGTYKIANILNEEKEPTRFNKINGEHKRKDPYTKKEVVFKNEETRWRGNVIYDIITNPIYKGEKRLGKKSYSVVAIITKSQWERVNRNLVNNKKNVGKKAQYNYMLNGIIICGHCGRNYVGKKRLSSGDNAYKCKGKIYPKSECQGSRGINIPKLDSFIIQHLFKSKQLKQLLSQAPDKANIKDDLLKRISSEKKLIEKIKKKIETAYDTLLEPEFSDKQILKKRILELEEALIMQEDKFQKTENELALSRAGNRVTRTKTLLKDYFDGISFSDVKKLVHQLIDEIYIRFEGEKDSKKGTFIIQVRYKGYEEQSTFFTTWQAKKWLWVSNQRKKALSQKQTEEDYELLNDLIDYLTTSKRKRTGKITNKEKAKNTNQTNALNSKDFNGFETYTSMNEVIILDELTIVTFD